MPAELSEQVMVRVSPDLLDQIKAMAAEEDRSVAQMFRLAMKAYLNGGSRTATA